jgi:hypothetical protein
MIADPFNRKIDDLPDDTISEPFTGNVLCLLHGFRKNGGFGYGRAAEQHAHTQKTFIQSMAFGLKKPYYLLQPF